MKKVSKLIYWLILILSITSVIFISLYRNNQEIASPSGTIILNSLYICEISKGTKDNAIKSIKMCGVLVSEKEPIPLRIYIYRMPEKVLVAENNQEDVFYNGKFMREFNLYESDEGLYKVVVYFYRNIVSETEFFIRK